MWWLILAGLLACSNSDQADPEQDDVAVDAASVGWTVSFTNDAHFIPAGTNQALVTDSPLALQGPTIPGTEYRQVVGAARVVEIWPDLARLDIQKLQLGQSETSELVARPRQPEDEAIIAALPDYKAAKKSSGGNRRVVTKSAPVSNVMVPLDLKTGNAGQKINALVTYENDPSMSEAIIWVMKNDTDYEVVLKAWRVVRARWNGSIGNTASHEAAAVWLATNGSKDLRIEAIAAIGRKCTSLNTAAKHINDPDVHIRMASAEAVAAIGLRAGGRTQAREIIAAQVEREPDKRTAKRMGKLAADL